LLLGFRVGLLDDIVDSERTATSFSLSGVSGIGVNSRFRVSI
jgi:hypothetical protein